MEELGRSVNAGAKGIRILAPMVGVRRKKAEEAEKDITKQNERVLVGFRNAYVFDISQTNGVDLPVMQEVSGDPGAAIAPGTARLTRVPPPGGTPSVSSAPIVGALLHAG